MHRNDTRLVSMLNQEHVAHSTTDTNTKTTFALRRVFIMINRCDLEQSENLTTEKKFNFAWKNN